MFQVWPGACIIKLITSVISFMIQALDLTQVDYLYGAPLFGSLLALPAKIRLGWKVHLALYIPSKVGSCFYLKTLDHGPML